MKMNTTLPAAMAAIIASIAIISVPASAGTMPGTASAHARAANVNHANGGGALLRTGGERAAIGIGALIIGGVILSETARAEHRRDHGRDWDRCAHSYRSFDRDTGFYSDRDGGRRQCRYLN